jgi:transcriptional regulator with XRE-family HTH domain
MQPLRFQEILRKEFEERRKKNSRYSLRAYAASLETDHSTLSQVMRGSRRPPATKIRSWARKLGMSPEEATVYVAAQHLPDSNTAARQEQLRHWTAEAVGVVTEPAHWQILRLSRTTEFKPDCRWIANQIGSSVDAVNVALSRLLRLRLLKINRSGEWTDLTGLKRLTESAFCKLALVRVREEAAKANIKLSGPRSTRKSAEEK